MPPFKRDDLLTAQQYLALELTSDIKHEYVQGELIAMAGASPNHGRISSNISRKLGNHIEGSACEVFSADMKVRTASGSYRYPDVLVVCDEHFIDNGYVTKTPTIIVEVLSRSTRKTDEREKVLEYINIPTLQEYLIIEQDIADITVYRRNKDWHCTHYFLGDEITLDSINLTIQVEDIYQRVQNEDVSDFLKQKDKKEDEK